MQDTAGGPADSSLAPKYIGAIFAGVVGFILIIALAVWTIKRHLDKVMRAVDKTRGNTGKEKNEPTPRDTDAGAVDGARADPGLHEVHGQPSTSELWDPFRQGSLSPDHRWELRGSDDAHGTSELDATGNRSKLSQTSTHQ
ncbi:hypothetical protein PG993_013693 [Apiospora rasikravindrae]|uniref:Uncharacterized protein n=1 Tax=Apiospora rasikravindrae TaxID=990691 RepID=A0ABR1RR88_9PEZI